MKKKQIIYLLLVVCLGAFYGCSQEGFDTYQSENYIHFNKSENDSTTFSFAYDPSLTEGEVDIKLNIISRLEDRDRHFSVKFVPEESTAKEGVDFNVSTDELIVKANDSRGYYGVKQSRNKSKKIHVIPLIHRYFFDLISFISLTVKNLFLVHFCCTFVTRNKIIFITLTSEKPE